MTRASILWLLALVACSCYQHEPDSTRTPAIPSDPRKLTAAIALRLQTEQGNRAFVADLLVSELGKLEECRVRDCRPETEKEICQSIESWDFSEGESGSRFTVVFGRGSLQ
jgi:hypothetical protein